MRRATPILLSVVLLFSCDDDKATDASDLSDTSIPSDADTDTDTDTDTDIDTDLDLGSPPTAVDDVETVDEGDSVTVDLIANDGDVDEDIDRESVLIVDGPVNGLVVINGDGSIEYFHDGSETVDDSFTYSIKDLTQLESNAATVDLVVNPVNDPPIANDDAGIVQEGSFTNINLSGDDVDVDDGLDLTSIVIIDPPSFGTTFVNGDGSVTYTHDGSELPSDSFRYTIDDLSGATSNIGYVTISIIGSNDSPVAVDDINFLDQGALKVIDLAINDSDPDDGLNLASIRIVGQPVNGTVTPRLDGTVDYTHDDSPTLVDSFQYTIDDLSGASSNVATVDLTIHPVPPVNVPPTAVDDVGSADEGTTGNIIDLAGNDTDPDDGIDVTQIVITTLPVNGTVQVVGDGTVDYTHDGTETVADGFAYTIDDFSGAQSNAATVLLTINPVNDAPVANDDGGFVDEGEGARFDLSGNDTDIDDGVDPAGIVIVVPPANGMLLVNADGTVDYGHDGSETTSDAFAYTITDFAGAVSNVAVVDVVVGLTNDAPVAIDDVGATLEGGVTTIDMAVNDTDADDGIDVTSIAIVTPPTNGTLVDNADGSFDYTHNGTETTFDSFSYTIDDMGGLTSNTAIVNVTISAVNTPPVATDDAATLDEGALEVLDLAANDVDIDSALNLSSIQIVTAPINGSLVVNGDGTVDYQHDSSNTFNDSFSYTIEDAFGALSNIANVALTINPVNDLPVANDDAGATSEGGATNINLGLNDTDNDGTIDNNSVVVTNSPTSGTLVIHPNGTVDYFHDGSEGVIDTFTYTIDDNLGGTSNEATVTIDITSVNDVPVAVDDAGVVDEDSVANFDLGINDLDPDDGLDLASIAISSPPTSGLLVVNADGTVDYTHDGSETLSDGFLYTIQDVGGQTSNTALVSITINPVNDPPVAVGDAGFVDQGLVVNVFASFNDTDADDGLDLGSIQIITPPAAGTAVPQANGSIDYTHDDSNVDVDSFTYSIDDAAGATSNIVTVDITITILRGACGVGLADPSYVSDMSFSDALSTTTMTMAWDGVDFWSSSGGGPGGDRLAQYDGNGAFISFYQPNVDWRAVFTKEDGVGPLYARGYASTQIRVMSGGPGVFVNDVSLSGGSLDAQAAVAFDTTRREFVALTNGSVQRWDESGNFVGAVALVGFGTLGNESSYPADRGVAWGCDHYLTYSDETLSSWDTTTGVRIASTTLTGAGLSFDSNFSISYTNERVYIVTVAGGLWQGYDVFQ